MATSRVRKIRRACDRPCALASWTAEATVGHADALGFGATIKLVWLLNGTMTYEDRERAIAVNPGELFVTRSSFGLFSEHKWRLRGPRPSRSMLERTPPGSIWWSERQRSWCYEPSSAAAASAAGMLALMRSPVTGRHQRASLSNRYSSWQRDRSITVSLIRHRNRSLRSLFRARWLIRQICADLDYTPARLAHDLGLSRRSLYSRFADCGITPAASHPHGAAGTGETRDRK